MKVCFVSNYFNHHQSAFCDRMYALTQGNFAFVATAPMGSQRRALGYGTETVPGYVHFSYTGRNDRDTCRKLIREADVVIAGQAPEWLLRERVLSRKLMLRYQERPLKKEPGPLGRLGKRLKWHWLNPPFAPVYLLCASASCAGDYDRFGLFRGKCFRWGYFPETRQYDTDALFSGKDPALILWAGRFLDWKHPDDALWVAKALKDRGLSFRMRLIGAGDMEPKLRQRIRELELEDRVSLTGAMKPAQVRCHMEKAGIFLFTSDRREGWGAVLNEAMNSGCAVVASHAAGAVPFLLKDGETGLIYPSGNQAQLTEKTACLLESPAKQRRLGEAAYRSIATQWNADTASARILKLSQVLLSGGTGQELYAAGPCSRAEVLEDNWFEEGRR